MFAFVNSKMPFFAVCSLAWNLTTFRSGSATWAFKKETPPRPGPVDKKETDAKTGCAAARLRLLGLSANRVVQELNRFRPHVAIHRYNATRSEARLTFIGLQIELLPMVLS